MGEITDSADRCVELAREAAHNQDFERALFWARKAASEGHPDGMYILGFYATEDDDRRAWLRRASELGHTQAMIELGVDLWNVENRQEAEVWFKRAALAGAEYGCFNYGVTLINRAERNEARVWFAKAASMGNQRAREILEEMDRPLPRQTEDTSWHRRPWNDQTPDGWRYK